MLVLVIRTDRPTAELGLYQDNQKTAYKTWEAHRALAETLHKEIKALLSSAKLNLDQINGIVAFKGPGSFTGLRIGLSVANALAYGLSIPVVSADGEDWVEKGLERLKSQENEVTAMPEYGAAPHITQQRK
ncbi:MAG: tRNA (adenosine(37)-N6)-threonylcarbamoyltransferase complex dimerization subunit type 1 TsaB [Candidatus Saccharimonadales bacterium]